MSYSYPKKYILTGFIELNYRNYDTISKFQNSKSQYTTTSFEQVYKVGVQGYVYDPRLLIFSTSVSFRNDKTEVTNSLKDKLKSKDTNYDFWASFLPSRPFSLDVYASKTDSTVEGLSNPQDISSNHYGALLRYSNKKLPRIQIGYDHWDYTTERMVGRRLTDIYIVERYGLVVVRGRVKQKTEIDRSYALVNGFLESVNTKYFLGGNFSKQSNSSGDFSANSARISTYTTIRQNSIHNSFAYSKTDFSTLLNFISTIYLTPIGRFYHHYSYEFFTSEVGREGYRSNFPG